MYNGNIASLNSAQLSQLNAMQPGGLTSTQLGQALASQVDSIQDQQQNKGPENMEQTGSGVEDIVLTDSAKQIADLISRGFTENMAERLVASGKYFASYD